MKLREIFRGSTKDRSRDPAERWRLTQILVVLLTAAFLWNIFFAH